MKIKYKITEVRPKIFHVAFKDQYDMCMTFLRAQETYESPNPNFRNKVWNKQDFMRWYAKAFGKGVFSYPNDWGGFNVPSSILEFIDNSYLGEELDEYDATLLQNIWGHIFEEYGQNYSNGNDKFYLIGTLEGAEQTIHHEVAHGFWYTLPKYKKEMLALVKKMKPALRKRLCSELAKIGYTKQVFDDECQAYMSTGLSEKFGITLKGEDKPFIEVFKRYYEK
jgi:hypothetical protein